MRKGMTWTLKNHNCKRNIDLVGCKGCNPYSGDTVCRNSRKVLCIRKLFTPQKLPRPSGAFVFGCSTCAMPNEFYYGWSEGFIKTTEEIQGCSIKSKAHADLICREHFGWGW